MREPIMYYGGRGNKCKPCLKAGDKTTNMALGISGLAIGLVVIVVVGKFFKKRALREMRYVVEVAAATAAEEGNLEAVEHAAAERAAEVVASRGRRMARLRELAGRLGPKVRILISLAQVLSQVTTTYNIRFPDLYNEMLSALAKVNFPIKLLPFGCNFPNADNFMFDLVVQTGMPLRESPIGNLRAHAQCTSGKAYACACLSDTIQRFASSPANAPRIHRSGDACAGAGQEGLAGAQ